MLRVRVPRFMENVPPKARHRPNGTDGDPNHPCRPGQNGTGDVTSRQGWGEGSHGRERLVMVGWLVGWLVMIGWLVG